MVTGDHEQVPELLWHNKYQCPAPHSDSPDQQANQLYTANVLREIGTFGSDPARNLLIRGDAVHALRALEACPGRARSIKLAYIDPPFNRGYTHAQYRDKASHAAWLTLLRDCLVELKDLLSDDGSVWLHLDDTEQHRARVVMDEIFGPEHFVSTVIWDRTQNPRVTGSALPVRHDYIHVYRKSPSFRLRPLETEDGHSRRAHTIWGTSDAGSGREAMAESRQLFGEPFATPKPERLVARVIALATEPGDAVLDCFAGSGTTAAVAHKLDRRWVAVEVQESTVRDFLQERLVAVVAGTDAGGITQAAGWSGGGGFTRFDVESTETG